MRPPDELRALVEAYLAALALTPELHGLRESMRYALDGGGKRIRPVLVLATGEAAGGEAERLLPAAAALELVHTFSLVHDDLPGARRRRRAARAAEHARRVGEGWRSWPATRCSRRRCGSRSPYPTPEVARELAGDARDDRRPVPRHHGGERRSRDDATA